VSWETFHDLTWRRFAPFGLGVSADEFRSVKAVNKFGFNADVDTVEETVWDGGGRYSYLGSAQPIFLSSESANDTAAGGGARTVQIYGLDAAYEEVTEVATLAGQTPVTLANSFFRINRMIVRTAGNSEGNIGVVHTGVGSVTTGTPSLSVAQISGGENQTLMALWTVPASREAYISRIQASSFTANGFATIRLVARPQSEVWQVKAKTLVGNDHIAVEYGDLPIGPFDEKTDIEVRQNQVAARSMFRAFWTSG